MRRIGVLMSLAADDTEAQTRMAAFRERFSNWAGPMAKHPKNDTRWAAGDPGRFRNYAAELVALRVEIKPINVRDAATIEREVVEFARSPNVGLIVTPSALAVVHSKLIIALAAKHRLPAVYYRRHFAVRLAA